MLWTKLIIYKRKQIKIEIELRIRVSEWRRRVRTNPQTEPGREIEAGGQAVTKQR